MQTLESGVGDVGVRSIRQTIGSTASVGSFTRRGGFSVTQHNRHLHARADSRMMPHAGLAAAAPRVETTRAPRGGGARHASALVRARHF